MAFRWRPSGTRRGVIEVVLHVTGDGAVGLVLGVVLKCSQKPPCPFRPSAEGLVDIELQCRVGVGKRELDARQLPCAFEQLVETRWRLVCFNFRLGPRELSE